MTMEREKVLGILRQNIVPSFGCTDPITPALAAAIAYRAAGGGTVVHVAGQFSPDVWIGAHRVVIPGTLRRGIKNAIAFGLAGGDPDRGLLVLENIGMEHSPAADRLLETVTWELETAAQKGPIYVDLVIETEKGTAQVVFDGSHSQYRVKKPGEEDAAEFVAEKSLMGIDAIPTDMKILWEFAETFEAEELTFLADGIRMNMEAGQRGLAETYPMNLGLWLRETKFYPEDSVLGRAKVLVCSATDARMGGGCVPVMSVFGSGNQGIVLFNTLGVWAEHHGVDEEKLLRSIALAAMIAGQIRFALRTGTPFCKCALIAASAVSAGLVFQMDGSVHQAEIAAQMTIASLGGILCDGAKPSCSLKLSVACGSAMEHATLAVLPKIKLDIGGLMGEELSQTIENVAAVGRASYLEIEQCLNELLQ